MWGWGSHTAQLLLSRPPPHSIPTMPSNSSRGLYPRSAEPVSVNLGEEREEPEYNQKRGSRAARFKSQ